MGRRALTPTPRWDGTKWRLRFTHEGTRFDYRSKSIGENEKRKAAQWASELMCRVYSGEHAREQAEGSDPGADFLEVCAAYFAEVTGGAITPRTAAVRQLHVTAHLSEFFAKLSDIDHGSLATYQSERLKKVRFATVKKELSTLRQILLFAEARGWIAELPKWPRRPGKSLGTHHRYGAKGFTRGFTEEMARAILPHLPELSRGEPKWPVRLYFEFLLETGLRPGTVTGIRLGTHWRPGSDVLQITEDIDKNKFSRDVRLTRRAIEILERTPAQVGGRVFHAKDFRTQLRAAARKAGLPPEIAERVKPYDFRHARITRLVATGHVLGAGYVAGHLQMTTTNQYSHANQKQAAELIALVDGSTAKERLEGLIKELTAITGIPPIRLRSLFVSPPDSGADSGAIPGEPNLGELGPDKNEAEFGCAKERTRTSTGVTPLAPQGAEESGNHSENGEYLALQCSGVLSSDQISGRLPHNSQRSLGTLVLAAIASELGLERRVA